MALIGSLVVNLKANTSGFAAGLKSGQKSLATFAKSITSTLTSVSGLGAVLSVAGITAFTKSQFEAIDAAGNLAERLNITTEALVGLQHAANLADVSGESLEKGLGLLSMRLGEAVGGSKAAQQAFENIGLDFKELSEIPLDQALLKTADAIKAISNSNVKAAATGDLFGAKNKEIILLLNKGSAVIKAAQEEAKLLGLTFTEIDARKIEEADIAMKKMGAAFSAAGRQLAILFAPAVKDAGTVVVNFIKFAKENGQQISAWTKAVVSAAVAFKTAGILLSAWEGITRAYIVATKAATAATIAFDAASSFGGLRQLGTKLALTAVAFVGLNAGVDAFTNAIKGANSAAQAFDPRVNDPADIEGVKKDLENLEALRAKISKQNFGMTKEELAGIGVANPFANVDAEIEAAKKKLEGFKKSSEVSVPGFLADLSGIFKVDSAIQGLTSTFGKLKKAFDLSVEIGNFTKELEKGIDTFGMSSAEIKRWELSQKGATAESLKGIDALIKQQSGTEDAAKAFSETRTPLENFQKELARLQELQAGGFLKEGVFDRASAKAFEDAQSALGGSTSNVPTEVKLPQAALAGSSEAISALNKFQAQGPPDPQKTIAALTKVSVDVQQQQLAELRKIFEASRGGGAVVKF